ncbi:TolC family protein [Thermodesulfobium acidiphilum]|nr:TolC family protein [Thermodesulfobium acidiphilum]
MQNLIEANPDLEIAKKEYDIAKMQVELDKIALYPTLFGSVTYNNYSNPVQTSTYNVFTTGQNGVTNSYTETLTPLQERYNEFSTNIG